MVRGPVARASGCGFVVTQGSVSAVAQPAVPHAWVLALVDVEVTQGA